ncbi:MAG: ATPase, T2SS/T4P/T4SS family [Lachnospiraceae bacterium]
MDTAVNIYDNMALLGSQKITKTFPEVLKEVQAYVAKNYAQILGEYSEDNRDLIKSYIEKYVETKNLSVHDMDQEELTELIYGEMTGYSFLSKYMYRDDVEEINVNQWDDVKITYSNGEILPSKEGFNSPSHATDVIRRMLQKNGMVFDLAEPIVVGHLSKKIRITVMGEGVVDKDRGLSASIRIVNPKKLQIDDFVRYGTATEEMLEFLANCFSHGVSMCITGATSSGKTTLMSWILSRVPYTKRLVTIEQNVREFNLTAKNEEGKVVNNVVHLCTRFSDDPKQNIDSVKLLETTLTINPDCIAVAEMKGVEAFLAIMAANTGHAVVTTIHANSCFDTYYRMVTLSKQMYNMDDNSLMGLATKAFPIVVFAKKLEDNSRRIMEITECERIDKGFPILRTLFRFKITDTMVEDGKTKIIGYYEKVNNPTESLMQRLRENGMPLKLQEKMFRE